MEIHPALIHFLTAVAGFWFFALLALGLLMAAQENKLNKQEVKIYAPKHTKWNSTWGSTLSQQEYKAFREDSKND